MPVRKSSDPNNFAINDERRKYHQKMYKRRVRQTKAALNPILPEDFEKALVWAQVTYDGENYKSSQVMSKVNLGILMGKAKSYGHKITSSVFCYIPKPVFYTLLTPTSKKLTRQYYSLEEARAFADYYNNKWIKYDLLWFRKDSIIQVELTELLLNVQHSLIEGFKVNE